MDRRKMLTALVAFVASLFAGRALAGGPRPRSVRKTEVIYLEKDGRFTAITTWRHERLAGSGDTIAEARDDLIATIERFEERGRCWWRRWS